MRLFLWAGSDCPAGSIPATRGCVRSACIASQQERIGAPPMRSKRGQAIIGCERDSRPDRFPCAGARSCAMIDRQGDSQAFKASSELPSRVPITAQEKKRTAGDPNASKSPHR